MAYWLVQLAASKQILHFWYWYGQIEILMAWDSQVRSFQHTDTCELYKRFSGIRDILSQEIVALQCSVVHDLTYYYKNANSLYYSLSRKSKKFISSECSQCWVNYNQFFILVTYITIILTLHYFQNDINKALSSKSRKNSPGFLLYTNTGWQWLHASNDNVSFIFHPTRYWSAHNMWPSTTKPV